MSVVGDGKSKVKTKCMFNTKKKFFPSRPTLCRNSSCECFYLCLTTSHMLIAECVI